MPPPPDPVRNVQKGLADQHAWGAIRWLFRGTAPSGALTFGHVEIAAGQKNPRHFHPNTDEVLYLLEGTLSHTLGDEAHQLEAGDAIYIPAGVPHDATNPGPGPALMLVAYATGEREMVLCD